MDYGIDLIMVNGEVTFESSMKFTGATRPCTHLSSNPTVAR